MQEFEQQGFVEGKYSLMHTRLSYINAFKFTVYIFPLALI
jgi:hypothetical protein